MQQSCASVDAGSGDAGGGGERTGDLCVLPAGGAEKACCGTSCIDTMTDGGNCGFCGNVCQAGSCATLGACTADPSCSSAPPPRRPRSLREWSGTAAWARAPSISRGTPSTAGCAEPSAPPGAAPAPRGCARASGASSTSAGRCRSRSRAHAPRAICAASRWVPRARRRRADRATTGRPARSAIFLAATPVPAAGECARIPRRTRATAAPAGSCALRGSASANPGGRRRAPARRRAWTPARCASAAASSTIPTAAANADLFARPARPARGASARAPRLPAAPEESARTAISTQACVARLLPWRGLHRLTLGPDQLRRLWHRVPGAARLRQRGVPVIALAATAAG